MEKQIELPYGKGHIIAKIPTDRLSAILSGTLDEFVPNASSFDIVKHAMQNPIASKPLYQLAKNKDKVVIIASDHTRPVPSKLLMPFLLQETRKGNPFADITILIATGCHRETSKAELINKFGKEIVENEKIVVHDCHNQADMVELGTLPSGGTLSLNRLAVQADLLIAEGFIEPHFFAGYSGGRKSVLPGVASATTVYYNHCSSFISDKNASYGSLAENPIQKDMMWAASKARLAYILNVVINSKHEVIAAYAGDFDKAHLAGVSFLDSLCLEKPVYSDIVISTNNGYPLDQNIYQSVKGIKTASLTCKPGGIIIMVAKCEDGCGSDALYDTFANDLTLKEILHAIKNTPAELTTLDQWQAQVQVDILTKHQIIFVSDAPEKLIKDLRMIPATTIEDALSKAEQLLNNTNATITLIPQGNSIVIKEAIL